MTAEIITIGDEILIGQVVDTNAAWIAERLHRTGIDVVRMETVCDDRDAIALAVARARDAVDLTITTGGLGPTHDDVTREAIADVLHCELSIRDNVREEITRRYEQRDRQPPPSVDVQATVPDDVEVLPNAVGTAPGFWNTWDRDGRTRMLAVMPGVPTEMQVMLVDEVLPRVREYRDLHQVRSRVLLTTGIGESTLQERIRDLVPQPTSSSRLAYLPSAAGVRLRVTVSGEDVDRIDAELDRIVAALRDRLGRYIYGTGDDTLEAVVGRLLQSRGLTVAAAESCTGGNLVNRISDISGASAYFLGGVIAYCNSVKIQSLGVDRGVLEEEGAVSEAVALQMAHGARVRMGSSIGVSTTGIAGPTGGTPDKPVGTVWIAYAGPDGEEAVLLRLVKHRGLNKELTSTAVLDLVRRRVMDMKV